MSPSDRSGGSGGGVSGAGALLTVDLDAIATNYRLLSGYLGPSTECGAVVKADAYGLGLGPVAGALWAAGCRSFFVALTQEGLSLRALLPDAAIHVFNGVDTDTAAEAAAAGLVPVLNHPGQLEAWAQEARTRAAKLPAMVHVDTGITRLGLSAAEVTALAEAPEQIADLSVDAVMSHLACAEDPDNPLNGEQLARFGSALKILAPLRPRRASLANSSGIFLGPPFHFDLARPGAALYGINPGTPDTGLMTQTIKLQGKILQTRTIDTPSTVGYGATHRAEPGQRIATIGVGYADGFLRSLSNSASAFIGNVRVPVVGRVSMDLITIDVTAVPVAHTHPGALVDLIGPGHTANDLAREAGTIGYEILSALGRRFERRYLGGGQGGGTA
jgi:alanine racemase